MEIIGLLAGVCTTVALLPQIIKSYQTRSVKDFSWLYILIFGSGLIFWLIYGIYLNALPIILANSLTFIFLLCLVVMKIKFENIIK